MPRHGGSRVMLAENTRSWRRRGASGALLEAALHVLEPNAGGETQTYRGRGPLGGRLAGAPPPRTATHGTRVTETRRHRLGMRHERPPATARGPGRAYVALAGRHGDAWKLHVAAAPERARRTTPWCDCSPTCSACGGDVNLVSGHGTRDKMARVWDRRRRGRLAARQRGGGNPMTVTDTDRFRR